jgi:hypothetical protein
MIHERTIRARHKLISKLPITGELLRGTPLERTAAAKRENRGQRKNPAAHNTSTSSDPSPRAMRLQRPAAILFEPPEQWER